MLLAAVYEYPWVFINLLIFYTSIYIVNPHNFFLQKTTLKELFLGIKVREKEYELLKSAEKSSNKIDFYLYYSWSLVFRKLWDILEVGFAGIFCSFLRLDKFIFTFTLIWIQVLLLPLVLTFYWVFVLYWFFKIIYYWLMSKFLNKKFLLSNKTGIYKINPIIFSNDEIIIPVKCKIHDFVPKCFHSFKKSNEVIPSVDLGHIKVNNYQAWFLEPLENKPLKKVLLMYLIELLIRLIIKRPYILAFQFWGRLVSIFFRVHNEVTMSSWSYGILKSLSCVFVLGVPLHILHLTQFIVINCPRLIWSQGEKLKSIPTNEAIRLEWHDYVVYRIFARFSKETGNIMYTSPFPVDVDNIDPV